MRAPSRQRAAVATICRRCGRVRSPAADFERFDLLLAMDEANLAELRRRCPAEHRHKVRLLMDFATGAGQREVADPYFGGAQGFEQVLDQCERACAGLLATLRERLGN